MVDFTMIYEAVQPYLGTAGTATAIVGFLCMVLKVVNLAKQAKKTFSTVHAESIETIKKAFPEQIIVSIEPIVKNSVEKIKLEILDAVNTNWLNQITANNELMKAIGGALCTMKALPDSEKEKIADLLKIEDIETTKSLKVEYIPTEQPKIKEVNAKVDISID